MPRIADLVRNRGECTIGEGENVLHVAFRPDRYTPELEEVYWSIINRRQPAGAMAYLLSQVLVSWDLAEEDENGDPVLDGQGQTVLVSTDLERLRQLPNELISLITGAITEAMTASKDEAKNSRGGSLMARKGASHPRGTR